MSDFTLQRCPLFQDTKVWSLEEQKPFWCLTFLIAVMHKKISILHIENGYWVRLFFFFMKFSFHIGNKWNLKYYLVAVLQEIISLKGQALSCTSSAWFSWCFFNKSIFQRLSKQPPVVMVILLTSCVCIRPTMHVEMNISSGTATSYS